MARRKKSQEYRTPREWLRQQRDAWPDLVAYMPEPWRMPLYVMQQVSTAAAYRLARARLAEEGGRNGSR